MKVRQAESIQLLIAIYILSQAVAMVKHCSECNKDAPSNLSCSTFHLHSSSTLACPSWMLLSPGKSKSLSDDAFAS